MGPIRLVAKAGDREVEVPIRVREARTRGEPSRALGSLWARAKIDDLEEALLDGSVPDARARITELGLSHRLVTRFTSFVAVDSSRRVSSGNQRQVVQPAERPEDVDVAKGEGNERASVEAPPPAQAPAPITAAPSPQPGDDSDDLPGELAPQPEPAHEEPAYDSEAYEAAPTDTSSTQTGEALEVANKRGCGCRMVGAPSAGGVPLALGLGLVVLGWARRRRQRAGVELRSDG